MKQQCVQSKDKYNDEDFAEKDQSRQSQAIRQQLTGNKQRICKIHKK